ADLGLDAPVVRVAVLDVHLQDLADELPDVDLEPLLGRGQTDGLHEPDDAEQGLLGEHEAVDDGLPVELAAVAHAEPQVDHGVPGGGLVLLGVLHLHAVAAGGDARTHAVLVVAQVDDDVVAHGYCSFSVDFLVAAFFSDGTPPTPSTLLSAARLGGFLRPITAGIL